ncbi:biotin-protein ligase [Absidia repens]|uniref:Biotin-protein ligase n=1 Tax=Absidia repens TaxID=90262 RepID=A0A1X2IUC9_9FUNG|nr:biotin-protein ligase [Absidia repens]
MNILIYTGEGASLNAIYQTYTTLKLILGHAHDIIKVDAHTLRTEPWEDTCSLLVLPGGRDLPYCNDLNGDINRRIKNYVFNGGIYLGLCAGAYYASSKIAFEVGTPLEVKGSRELAFYPGLCRGTMYPGFVYDSNRGARSVKVKLHQQQEETVAMYYNGGGYFVEPESFPQTTVVATYCDTNDDGASPSAAAIVLCKVGSGSALLSAVHPEYDVTTTPDLENAKDSEQLKSSLKESRSACLKLLREQLGALGLDAKDVLSEAASDTPTLTPIYLCGITRTLTDSITSSLLELADKRVIKDANNRFLLAPWTNGNVDTDSALTALNEQWNKMSLSQTTAAAENFNDELVSLMIHHPPSISTTKDNEKDPQFPALALTPYFDIGAYFTALRHHRSKEWGGASWYRFGNAMLYSAVITSTQTILDRNYSFAGALPSGLVCLATNQIAGRGRGRNSWVSQSGALQFSLELRHSLQLPHAPVVFIQYIIALAVVESIRSRPGYEEVPIRLKWPNDIYADLPGQGLKKVGGLLVNSSFLANEFLLVIGCGINLSNSRPTVSINDVITQHNRSLARLTPEDMLANILVTFERFYNEFCEKGMGPWFLDLYYKRWLHSDKLVTLTTHDNVRAKIVGITKDYGMLEAIGLDGDNQRYTLQPDGNSFDMLKGLIIKKS